LPLGTRELVAADYVYQIKRLAHPRLHSPIFGLMAEYIVGLPEYAEKLKKLNAPGWIDLRSHALEGVEEVDRYTYRVTLKGRYPQFVYWLAMPFFSPIPWEAEMLFHRAAWSSGTSRSTGGRSARGHTCSPKTIRTPAWCSAAIRTTAAWPIPPKGNPATRKRAY
jgi:ABC-type transport system substrate-binding protein